MVTKVNTYAIRLKPGDDLKNAIQAFVSENYIKAGWIITCVGSLRAYSLRFANQQTATRCEGFFEIVALCGTVSGNGCHLHAALSDSKGSLTGGHLLEGCTVYTTAEIIIGATPELIFQREQDRTTGFRELSIQVAT